MPPCASILLQAMEHALTAAEYEKGNRCYDRDLADLMRSYVHVRLNDSIWEAGQAARRADRTAFALHQGRVHRLFDALLSAIQTVSDRWEFSVDAMVRDFEDAPLRYSPEEIRHHLYQVTWGGQPISDYWRTDRYEMIRDIYRPMTEAYLNACADGLAQGRAGLPPDAVRARLQKEVYQPALERFFKGPCPPPPAPSSAVETARRFLAQARRGEI